MPVTQTDQHNTDLTEILLALRLEDFDLRLSLRQWRICSYAAHVHVMDGSIQVARALIARASASRHRLCLNGRHPQDELEYFRELVLQATTRSLHAAASV